MARMTCKGLKGSRRESCLKRVKRRKAQENARRRRVRIRRKLAQQKGKETSSVHLTPRRVLLIWESKEGDLKAMKIKRADESSVKKQILQRGGTLRRIHEIE